MALHGRSVIVNDGNVEKALRKFKKKMQNSGILQELRDRETYVKPTTRRKTAKNQAVRRWKKYIDSTQLPTKNY